MEWIEARALKSSVLSQMAAKTNAPVIYNDDLWCLTGTKSVSCDDFAVEELLNLDFPGTEFQEDSFSDEYNEEKVAQGRNSNPSSSTFSGADEIDSLSIGELAVPVDELENLEWLSQFVDDSTSELSFLYSAESAGSFIETVGSKSGNRVEALSSPVQNIPVSPFPFPVPRKARSNRPREEERHWYLASSAESSSTSSSYASLLLPRFPLLCSRTRLRRRTGSTAWNNRRPRSRRGNRRLTVVQRPAASVRIVKFTRLPSGEQDRWAQKRCVTLVVSGSRQAGFYPNIDPLVARLFRRKCIQIVTGKSWRCG
ncbi:hypothetical protein Sango_0536600 [Sesamum angolense]|uniref:Uncharacterized protein n=1 Tax=Sesamum angolense TaxID=2727404 RepID=A0AAE1X545_9LAMI|nr:hypothetical protein Sango_0536600 [Sesamum angolense]